MSVPNENFVRRLRVVLGLYFLAVTILVAYVAFLLPVVISRDLLTSSWIGLGLAGLVLGFVPAYLERLETRKVWIVLVSLGFLATIFSGFYTVTNPAPAQCTVVVYDRSGFPLPWHYPIHTRILCPLNTVAVNYPPVIDTRPFLLDVLFFTSISFGILELFRTTAQVKGPLGH